MEKKIEDSNHSDWVLGIEDCEDEDIAWAFLHSPLE